MAGGDLSAARAHYQATLTITERLAALDPTNAQWQRDLEISKQRLAQLSTSEDEDDSDEDR